jgi:hypothetical protein
MFGDSFTVEFFGGSRDGDVVKSKGIPDFLEVKCGKGWIEVYERQNDGSPFIYAQIGYAEEEQWR